MADYNQVWDYQDRLFGVLDAGPVLTLSSGTGVTLNTTGMARITILPGAGATVTYSMVDTKTETSHDAGTSTNVTTPTTLDVEWPYYRITTAGGSARVAAV